MKIEGFEIENFKGVRKANIRFSDFDTARVHTLVGLNESGKTTLLEALHSFSPDVETELVVQRARSLEGQREQWVPRHKISLFTGDVKITAYVSATKDDWAAVLSNVSKEFGITFDFEKLPNKYKLTLCHNYNNGDYITTNFQIDGQFFQAKTRKQKIFRRPNQEVINSIFESIRENLPTIAYYPTFVFDFPEKIYLTDKDESPRNRFYRQLFQDILDYDGNGYTIEDHILARLHRSDYHGPWSFWFPKFIGSSDEEKAKQVISHAEKAVTDVVFSKWNEVFGEDVGNKEISIDLNYEAGRKIKNDEGIEEEPKTHDAYIQFKIKEGTNRYAVDDRSLGFRWFFSFLLFTQFRIHRGKSRPTIFIFDEPASNLHAAAQHKLLESFPAIASDPHRLIYSTHSHYMVDPKWLEQAYIVFNASSNDARAIIDDGIAKDSDVDIQAVPYRSFVHDHPNKTSYFQPILDTLEVPPSSFDYEVGGLIVEGKFDYYCLKLACRLMSEPDLTIFPATGSGTMGALVSLHRGWGLSVKVLFDADKGGKDGKKKLRKDLNLTDDELFTVRDMSSKMTVMEDMFSKSDIAALVENNSKNLKTVLLRKIQELLAANSDIEFEDETKSNMQDVVSWLKNIRRNQE